MQILHRFAGSIQRYSEELSDPDRYRPDHCPQCEAHRPLRAHGFYMRTVVDIAFDGAIRVRRYLCQCCRRTLSLLPGFALPYLRFGVAAVDLPTTKSLNASRFPPNESSTGFLPNEIPDPVRNSLRTEHVRSVSAWELNGRPVQDTSQRDSAPIRKGRR